jgi:hypothetical protein
MSRPSTLHPADGGLDPADRGGTFTVHVRPTPDTPFRGRVIHAATGDVAYFDSPEELVRYLIEKMGSAT